MNKLAQIDLFTDDKGFSGFGPLGLEGRTPSEAPSLFATFISSSIGLITIIGVIWFIFVVATGAVAIVMSGGDKNSMEAAKKKITSGVIGLVVTIAGLFIIDIIGNLLGIPDILNFTAMFSKIAGPQQ